MPTVLRHGPYRFFFYSNESDEPAHIHVHEGAKLAKFWLDPVALASSTRFASHELTALNRLVTRFREQLLDAWHVYFDSDPESSS